MARKSPKTADDAGANENGPDRAGDRALPAVMTPLDYMLSVMRDEDADIADRKWAAAHAAPYLHQKLPMAERPDDALMSDEEWLELLD